MLSIRPTALTGSHFIKKPNILPLIAYAVCWLDIVFGMRASTGERYHMVKDETSRPIFQRGINRLFAYIAMIAITLDNIAKIYIFGGCRALLCKTATLNTGSVQSIAWLPILFSVICPIVFQIGVIQVTQAFTLHWQQLFSVFIPPLLVPFFTTILATWIVSIVLCFIYPELTQWFFRLTTITPFITRLNGRFAAPLTRILPATIPAINAIFARCSVASGAERIGVKGVNGFLQFTLLAYLRSQWFTLWGILNILKTLQSTSLVPANFTPRLVAASCWRLLIELFKRLFILARSTDFGLTKERELSSMIQFRHSNEPPSKVCCLASKGAGNILVSEKISSILPQTRPTSQLMIPLAGRLAVL